MFALFPVEGDALSALLLGDAKLLQGVSGHWVGGGQQRGLGLVACLVSNEANHGNGAVGEGEAEGENNTVKCMKSKTCMRSNMCFIMENACATVGVAPLPVGSLHVALTLSAYHASPLLGDAVARLEAVVECSVTVVDALVEDYGGIFVRTGSGGGEGQQTGEHGLTEKRLFTLLLVLCTR